MLRREPVEFSEDFVRQRTPRTGQFPQRAPLPETPPDRCVFVAAADEFLRLGERIHDARAAASAALGAAAYSLKSVSAFSRSSSLIQAWR